MHQCSTTRNSRVFLDLNRFKVINDALGHNIGDQLLQLTAKRLSSAIPDNGFIARLGGLRRR
ncbi:diguanylate cyclase domain-containing protein [Bacillus atrophaeus]|uniref:diguanylate cyclase domain-containing protein n=1 Tax=Bacillus atrophaeus TaxID=1452 RepID=UPI002DB5B54D|nr:diguanylate cyclase [Bacillus atrophaeus]MEC0695403.1 diguanylate cyclase [Bacillus atrophaeus]